MRILQLTPGTGHFYCGSCLRDNTLVRALRAIGNDALIVPLYLPFKLESSGGDPVENGTGKVHMGGINMYLQHKLPALRHTPRFLADQLDRPGLLRWAAARGNMTDASDLGSITVSMLRGDAGRQRGELDKLAEWLADQPRPDVLCLSNVMLIGMARELRERLGVPIVCSLQGEAPFLDTLTEQYRADAWSILSERARDIDAFIAVSAWYGELMRERLGIPAERVHVVHNGIDPKEIAAQPSAPTGPTIGFLARQCADKGLPTLVEAFIELKRRDSVPGLRLRVCGVLLSEDRALHEQLRGRLEAAGCLDDVDFLPNVERDEKLEFLHTLSVMSVPATYGESFGLYLLEALAAGVPVVQPRHAAFPEILEATGGGVLCEPDDPASLADALGELLNDEPRRRELGERGRAAVLERFTEERMARGVEHVCKIVAPVQADS